MSGVHLCGDDGIWACIAKEQTLGVQVMGTYKNVLIFERNGMIPMRYNDRKAFITLHDMLWELSSRCYMKRI